MPSLELSIVYELVENGWTQARIAEYPAVITAAPTREGAIGTRAATFSAFAIRGAFPLNPPSSVELHNLWL